MVYRLQIGTYIEQNKTLKIFFLPKITIAVNIKLLRFLVIILLPFNCSPTRQWQDIRFPQNSVSCRRFHVENET